ncbi:hypothetical protein [Streptomyces sp. NPDC054829]
MTVLGSPLPQTGTEISCSGSAVSAPLQINAFGLVTLDFKGHIRFRVESNLPSGLGGVKLKIISEEYTADSPILGKVTLSQTDTITTPLSLLEVTGNAPTTFRNTFFHDFTLTIEKPPSGGGPLVLSNTKTLTTVCNTLKVFPPQGDIYQLQQPADFALVTNPTEVVAQLQQLPMARTHTP